MNSDSGKDKRSFVDHLAIDGVREYFASTAKLSKYTWLCIIILSYFCASYFSYLTVLRFDLGKTVVFSSHNPPLTNVFFPDKFTLYHTAFWNKTYMEENVRLSNEIVQRKASKLGLNSKTRVLSEFAKYMSYYNFLKPDVDEDEKIREDVWDLMTELFEDTLKDIEFADFVADAGIRSNIMEKCWFKNRRYSCDRATALTVDSPSCRSVPIHYGRYVGPKEYDSFEMAVVIFEINLPTEHTFLRGNDDAEDSGVENAGLTLMITSTATPFHPRWAAPANTHAVILYHHKVLDLKRNCIRTINDEPADAFDPDFKWWKTYETCLVRIFEGAAKNICGCHYIAGSYYPRNGDACTPNQIRKCVQTNVTRDLGENPEKYNTLKEQCKRRCWTDDTIAMVTYYNLENVSADHMRNVITIRPNLERGILDEEKRLTNFYAAFSEVGGVVGVYTGLSIAAFARVLALLCGAGLKRVNRRLLKPALSLAIYTPLGVRWDLTSILHYRHNGNRAFEFH